jgi:tRNA dimethylallyltransferase
MHTLLVITGPTAIGKTGLAIQLAQAYDTEILSADSRQFFREMNIGTAKPSPEELAAAPHHFINTLGITDNYDAGKYEAEAIELLSKLFQKKSVVILCGGSGMYVDAVCKGFDPLPEIDEKYRKQLNEIFKAEGLPALQQLLQKHDPEHYNFVDLNNPHRLIRALEISLATGNPYSSYRKGISRKRNFKIIRIGLNTNKEILHERINQRVDLMMQAGLESEVRQLYSQRHLNALQTVGYKELFDYIDGKFGLDEAIDLIKQNTRRFAKRQLTWFKKEEQTVWMDPFGGGNLLEQITTLLP